MRKSTVIWLASLIAAVSLTSALMNAQLPTTGNAAGSMVYSPSTRITADNWSVDQATKTTRARGHVQIMSDSSTITADEADMHHLSDSRTGVDLAIDLRGHVHVVIAPAGGQVIGR